MSSNIQRVDRADEGFHGTELYDVTKTVKLYPDRRRMVLDANRRVAAVMPLFYFELLILICLIDFTLVFKPSLAFIQLTASVVVFALFLMVRRMNAKSRSAFLADDRPTFEISMDGIIIELGSIGSFKMIPWRHVKDIQSVHVFGISWVCIHINIIQLLLHAKNLAAILLIAISIPFYLIGVPVISIPGNRFALDAESFVEITKRRKLLALEQKSK